MARSLIVAGRNRVEMGSSTLLTVSRLAVLGRVCVPLFS